MDIYDRSAWPPPEANPLVQLFLRGDEWYSNEEIVNALGLAPKRALLSNETVFGHMIDDADTALESRGRLYPGKSISRAHGGQRRMFNRRAFLLAAMRASTTRAAGFRFWLASLLMVEVPHG
ncbi:MAG TPA: hypothetical protein DDZ88_14815 [Verrucomicrobiales bacterium]|nr:hypothetical protein [Verrucomicrobiales bacterium]